MVEKYKQSEFSPIIDTLKPKWDNLCQRLNISSSGFDEIVNHYSEAHRSYHTLNHINHCLQELTPIKACLINPKAVELALWFHDIIYVIGKSDNEEKSAKMAKDFCQKNNLSPNFIQQVEDHILATKHIFHSDNPDSQYLADIDMAILGQSTDTYDIYETQIHQEFSTLYSPSDYQKGRTNFLKTVLERPIYSTDFFNNKYEQAARLNIQISLHNLSR